MPSAPLSNSTVGNGSFLSRRAQFEKASTTSLATDRSSASHLRPRSTQNLPPTATASEVDSRLEASEMLSAKAWAKVEGLEKVMKALVDTVVQLKEDAPPASSLSHSSSIATTSQDHSAVVNALLSSLQLALEHLEAKFAALQKENEALKGDMKILQEKSKKGVKDVADVRISSKENRARICKLEELVPKIESAFTKRNNSLLGLPTAERELQYVVAADVEMN